MKAFVIPFLTALALALPFSSAPFNAEQPTQGVVVKVEKDKIDFFVRNHLVTTYHVKSTWPRPFLWPLKAPDGAETTRAWPVGKEIPGEEKDHVHHRSAWFAHGDVIPEGFQLKSKIKGVAGIDFWTEGKNTGKIICTKVEEPKAARLGNSILTHNEWRTVEGDKIMDEDRTITFYDFGKAYLIVLDFDFHASLYPITFADTKEGTMAIRAHTAITVKMGKGKMQNAQGKINEKECWGQKSLWCDYAGKVGTGIAGLAIFDDPANPYPSCWHARDYGLLAANPFGREKHAQFPAMKGNNQAVRVAKGDHLQLRYGLLVHNGDAVEGQVGEYFERFVKLRGMEK